MTILISNLINVSPQIFNFTNTKKNFFSDEHQISMNKLTMSEDFKFDVHNSLVSIKNDDLTSINPVQSFKHLPTCTGCNQLIKDQFYMKIDESNWHEKCLKCCVCNQVLKRQCFVKQDRIYCHYDYSQLNICKRCYQPIAPNTKAFSGPVHVQCLSCEVCHRVMKPGDQYCRSESSELVCVSCKLMQMTTSFEESNNLSNLSDTESSAMLFDLTYQQLDGEVCSQLNSERLKNMYMDDTIDDEKYTTYGKRPRTILTTAQRKKFKQAFQISQKPTRKTRESLAMETCLSPRVVQVWFQNQRAKIKKIARKQQQHEASEVKNLTKVLNTDSESESSSLYSCQSLPTTSQLYTIQSAYFSPSTVPI